MSDDLYPDDLKVKLEHVHGSGWREAMGADEDDLAVYGARNELSNAAKAKLDAGEIEQGKVLWLLSDVSSMMIKGDSIHEPLRPSIRWGNKRTAIPDDFTDADLQNLEVILPEIDDYRLRARIADILWLRLTDRKDKHKNALIAIDAYRSYPLNHRSFIMEGREAWKRAIQLAGSLGRIAEDRRAQMRQILLDRLYSEDVVKGYETTWIAEILESLAKKEDLSVIAARLEEAAKTPQEKPNDHRYIKLLEDAATWYNKDLQKDQVHRLYSEIAEHWEKFASAQIKNDDTRHSVASDFFENAFNSLRRIPRKMRPDFNGEERLERLRGKMEESRVLSLDEMTQFSTKVDISEVVTLSRERIQGKSLDDALRILAEITDIADLEFLKKCVEEGNAQAPLQALIQATHLSSDGRVVARSGGIDLHDPDSERSREAFNNLMVRDHLLQMGLKYQSFILPALQVVVNEHRVQEGHLLQLCRLSHIIPNDRKGLWAKGLYYGFEFEFDTAIHLLIPQIEHMVRLFMKRNGLKTTRIEKGVETENSLSALLDHSDIETVLEDRLVFELKSLLTNPIGGNLRNDLAHGLLSDGIAHSPHAVYVWWLCFRLMIANVPWETLESTIHDHAE
ncbi:DUF4209 domain-containing protein [bacterium]|nr:DUF4209 domain-containing protein [bacterium]